MYLEYFGLHRLPFTISPDPDFLYPSRGHQEALAHLSYALTDQGGLICLTGEVGTGKTTLCRALIDSIPEGDHVAYIFNPQLSPVELLQSICDELGVEYSDNAGLKELYAELNMALLRCYAKHQRVICVIDEAQSMPAALLEQVRLLTNLETHKEKLLTLVLVGQPELRDLLSRHDLRQLNQRITARYHLDHLGEGDTAAYLEHRLVCAGGERMLFDRRAVAEICRASGGVPRLINSIADRALLGAYATGVVDVTAAIVRRAVKEVLGERIVATRSGSRLPLLTVLVLLMIAAGIFVYRFVDVSSLLPVDDSDPVIVLSKELGIEAGSCDDLEASGYRCQWVDWPLTELRTLNQAIAISDTPGHWQALSPAVNSYRGSALILWQTPEGYTSTVRPGQTDPVVRWVRSRLGVNWGQDWTAIGPGGVEVQADPDFYDPLLEQAVADFQIANGLKVDRIIGPRTLMYLQREQ